MPGVLSIQVENRQELQYLTLPVTLAPGVNRKRLPVPVLHTLTVVFEEGQKADRVQLSPATGRRMVFYGSGKKPGEDGKVVFEKIPAGQYRLSVLGNMGPDDMTVTVPAPGEVLFEPEPMNALAVTMRNPSGYFGTSGFQTGDLVIGIDGINFENKVQMITVFMGSMAKSEVKLKVLRGNQELEISVDPKKLVNSEDSGGEFEPSSR